DLPRQRPSFEFLLTCGNGFPEMRYSMAFCTFRKIWQKVLTISALRCWTRGRNNRRFVLPLKAGKTTAGTPWDRSRLKRGETFKNDPAMHHYGRDGLNHCLL